MGESFPLMDISDLLPKRPAAFTPTPVAVAAVTALARPLVRGPEEEVISFEDGLVGAIVTAVAAGERHGGEAVCVGLT